MFLRRGCFVSFLFCISLSEGKAAELFCIKQHIVL